MRKPSEKELSKVPQLHREHVQKMFDDNVRTRKDAVANFCDRTGRIIEAIPFLNRVMNEDKSEDVRIRAVKALENIEHPDAIEALKHAAINDVYWGVRLEAMDVLIEKVRQNAIPEFAHMIRKDEKKELRKLAATTLWELSHKYGMEKHPDAIAALKYAMKNDEKEVSSSAASAVETIVEKLPPSHPLKKAAEFAKPSEYPKSFVELHDYIQATKGRKPAAHYRLYAKQLKAAEPVVKREAA